MRLINVHNRHLQEFYDVDVPDYAILSHTWSDDEVTFEDMINNRGQDKEAYRKIRFLCNQATADRVEWAWLDTCCINKDSSAELSEAINSMFRWYNNAEYCYAYLDDVSSEIEWSEQRGQPINHSKNGPPWQTEFAKARWFSRGWTLQELLAPRNVKFFGRGWNHIGGRTDLAPIIASITNCRESILRAPEDGIKQCSVSEKMSWAANRETSRIEDKAYCLLGIFEVNMPLLYGEGSRAFQRLQEEIIRSSNDHSIFVWQPQTSAEKYLLLAPTAEHFTHGGAIVTIPDLHNAHGYSLGNIGLSITLPIIQTGPADSWHAILGCRYRDDYQNIIALCLKGKPHSSAMPGKLHVAPTIAHLQRYVLQRAPLTNEDLPKLANITITRDLPKEEVQKETADAKYWFNLDDSKAFNIVAAYPSECFNSQTLVMDLTNSREQYGAVLLSLTDDAVRSPKAGPENTTIYTNSLAVVFGAWSGPDEKRRTTGDSVGLFGVVQSNLKNLGNACRFAVSRSIYRTREASQQHVAWVRGIYCVPWGRTDCLNVAFRGDQTIGLLKEVVNIINITLTSPYKSRAQLTPVLKQSKEPDGNPLGVERLQDFVRSWNEDENDEEEVGINLEEAPKEDTIYELEDDSWRVHPPNDDDDSETEYFYEE